VREYTSEPVRGLPENLPEGEHILWQGGPKWTALAVRALHVRAVAIYFALLAVWFAGAAMMDGASALTAAAVAARVLAGAAAALALLGALAFFLARAAFYTITNRRVVMRFGIALPMILNIPYRQIKSADLKVYRDGTGDIPLTVTGPQRQSMVVLWPHVRPWHTVEPQPMLRCVPDASRVAEILATAIRSELCANPDIAAAQVKPTFDGQRIREHAAA
jgi:hypothetical protein